MRESSSTSPIPRRITRERRRVSSSTSMDSENPIGDAQGEPEGGKGGLCLASRRGREAGRAREWEGGGSERAGEMGGGRESPPLFL